MPTLTWLTRDDDTRVASKVPYRLLEEAPELGHGDRDSGNMLIQGDNLEALKALLPFYAGRVKCIYIDPPYNTKSAFEHYDDNLEHSQWLAMIYPRLELLREFLSDDGAIWISIDDNEGHYLKVLCDEIFGRSNFIDTIIWRKNYSPKSSARHFSSDHDYLIVFAKNADLFVPNLMPRTEKQNNAYKNLDNDFRGPWKTSDLSARNYYSLGRYPITTPSGRLIKGPPGGNYWRVSEQNFWKLDADKRIWWGKNGDAIPQIKRFLSEVKQGVTPQTFWSYEDVGHTQDAKKEILNLFDEDVFLTPKPELLMQRVLQISSGAGDIVLDSFLGSGTTAAVAHKMGRQYIGIEMGEHAVTHCAPRLRKVIDGEQGGISEAVGWKGGGGFRFYRLGPPVFDADGHIRRDITFPVLASHVWFSETGAPWNRRDGSPVLGIHHGTAYALLYNGILGDKRPNGGNVLTTAVLRGIRADIAALDPSFDGPLVVYGESARLGETRLKALGITFKQTPYDVKAR
ncbi:MAG TPA: site-specific DNA-methyltransferase [Azospirillum sp.]|nr:site-specific DNA-methyltransferase [Azospirillum sp.]